MAGEDRTSAAAASPPRPPMRLSDLTADRLLELGDEVVRATWTHGLPQLFWGEGVCLLGMANFAAAAGRAFPTAVHDWLVDRVERGIVLDHVNNVAPATAAVLDGTRRTEPLVSTALDWIADGQGLTRDAAGTIEHWPGGVWADTVFMAGVFLGRAGEARSDRGLVDECGRQLLAHARALQDPGTGLFIHGTHRGEAIRCFWGRANAWTALATVEYLEICDRRPDLADPELAAALATVLRRQLAALIAHQPDHGVWSVLVDDQVENAGILETSAAAGIGAAMIRATAVLPDLPEAVRLAGWRAVAGSLAYLESGTLTRVSAGTVLQLVPFGYSVIRDDRPQLWGQGLALHAIAAALANSSSRPD